MEWYIVDKNYINYLKQFDSKVQNIDYGSSKLKPYIGILLEIQNIKYCVPVSSPKQKHMHMNDGIDFIKITNLTNTHLFGVLNLNNMIPVKNSELTDYRIKILINI